MIYLRAESICETRAPLVPADVGRLSRKVIVQRSAQRVFADADYAAAGAELTDEPWWNYPDALILGLKELTDLDKLSGHSHVYFAHCYRGQQGATDIMTAFATSGSRLYDLEYFRRGGKRVLAFGFYAGIVGAAVGLMCPSSVKPWPSLDAMFADVPIRKTRVAIIGSGRCARGVRFVLDRLGMPYTLMGRSHIDVSDYDILFNCILLDPSYTEKWIPKEPTRPLVIVDISCDYTKKNNPLPYSQGTTWEEPVLRISNNVSVIAIDNLPSLLPIESSIEFSAALTDLLGCYGDACWTECLDTFTHIEGALAGGTRDTWSAPT
jgi:saccharopine dehydrogenase (NAD+, L-lysine-forming)